MAHVSRNRRNFRHPTRPSTCKLLDALSEASGNTKAVALITQISPVAWRHILLNGHYTFQSDRKMIDLDALVAGLELV